VALAAICASSVGAVHLRVADGLAGYSFGGSVSELADQDGDGRWEFLVGAPFYSAAGLDNGRVLIWFGNDELTFNPDIIYNGQDGELFGYCVARVGDVNDDNIDDFAVGAPGSDIAGMGAGRVYLFYGGAPLPAAADVVLEGPAPGDSLGFSISAAGDIDHDGIDDLIVGAPYHIGPSGRTGAAYVYYGGGGIGPDPDLALYGEVAGDLFGWSVTDCGNFTGDTADCVAVGAPLNGSYAGTNSGAVYVFEGALGPALEPDATPEHIFTSSGNPAGRFGFVVRGVGRWDYDSYDDLAVGAPWDTGETGRVEVFFGGTDAGPSADRYVAGETGGDYFGWSLADLGDAVDNDRDDLLIGAPRHSADASDAGRAYIFPGGSGSGFSQLEVLPADGIVPGTLANDLFGRAVSGCGDFDGDDTPDYAVSAPWGNDDNNAVSGYVKIYDSSGSQVPTLVRAWEAVWSDEGAARLRLGLNVSAAGQELALCRVLLAADGSPLDEEPLSPVPLPASGSWTGEDAQAAAAVAAQPGAAGLAYRLTLIGAAGERRELGLRPGPDLPAPTLSMMLAPPAPNPMAAATTVRFRARAGEPLECSVYDLRGVCVTVLLRGTATGGWQEILWDGRAEQRRVAAGIYLIRLRAGDRSVVRRVVISP
jgi:hypothetical protein